MLKRFPCTTESGTVIYSTDPGAIGSKKSEHAFFVWALKSENKENITDSRLF